jgi:hypothetical protein
MTSLVAVAVPAAAGSSDTSATPPGLGPITGQLQPSTTPTPSASAATGTGSSTNTTSQPAADAPTTAPASSAGCSPTGLAALLTCLSSAGGGTNPLTSLITQLQAAAAGGGGAPGLPTTAFQDLAGCIQRQLTSGTPDGAKIEGCFSTFAKALTGAPQATCLDPILQGTIAAVQDLVQKQDPAPLQAELTGLQGQLTTLASCLQGTANTPTPTTGTSTSSGEATTPATTTASDPTVAVPVAATPTFTG